MDPTLDLVAFLNIISLVSFSVLSLAIFGRLAHRFFLYRESSQPVPILLWRDIILFTGLTALLLSAIVLRISGVSGLSSNLLWIVFSNTVIQIPLAYWAWVEYTQ